MVANIHKLVSNSKYVVFTYFFQALYGELSKQFSRLGGKMFTMIGPMPCLLTNDSNLVKFAMTSKSIKKSVVYDLGRIFLGDGIIVSDGKKYIIFEM